MKLVAILVGTPYDSEYNRRVTADSLLRGEAPFNIMDQFYTGDTVVKEMGAQAVDIENAVLDWIEACTSVVVYTEKPLNAYGERLLDEALDMGISVQYRVLLDREPEKPDLPVGLNVLVHLDPNNAASTKNAIDALKTLGIDHEEYLAPSRTKYPYLVFPDGRKLLTRKESYIMQTTGGSWGWASARDFEAEHGTGYRNVIGLLRPEPPLPMIWI